MMLMDAKSWCWPTISELIFHSFSEYTLITHVVTDPETNQVLELQQENIDPNHPQFQLHNLQQIHAITQDGQQLQVQQVQFQELHQMQEGQQVQEIHVVQDGTTNAEGIHLQTLEVLPMHSQPLQEQTLQHPIPQSLPPPPPPPPPAEKLANEIKPPVGKVRMFKHQYTV